MATVPNGESQIQPDQTFHVARAPADTSGPRLLFITNMWPDPLRPYYGSFIFSQAQSLIRVGISVDVAYVRGFLGLSAYARTLPQLMRLARDPKYALVHVHAGHTAAQAVLAGRHPLVISFCGGDLLGEPRASGLTPKSRVEMNAFRQLSRLADATITKSRQMEQQLPASQRGKNHVLPNGVDLAVFSPIERAEARQRLGWHPDEAAVLFVGNPDDPRKNVELARAATDIVSSSGRNVRLEVAWGINPADVPALMNASDCLLFTSRSEGSPNVIKEAMACELPIVATPVGDVEERLAGVAGTFVVDADADANAVAEKVDLALRVGRTPAARKAVAELGIDLVARRLLDIYTPFVPEFAEVEL